MNQTPVEIVFEDDDMEGEGEKKENQKLPRLSKSQIPAEIPRIVFDDEEEEEKQNDDLKKLANQINFYLNKFRTICKEKLPLCHLFPTVVWSQISLFTPIESSVLC